MTNQSQKAVVVLLLTLGVPQLLPLTGGSGLAVPTVFPSCIPRRGFGTVSPQTAFNCAVQKAELRASESSRVRQKSP
jgi:hypothetical protein